MTKDNFDLIVLGSGPSGRRAAIQAAKLDKKVLVIEDNKLGGVSVHTGTVPSKTMRESVLNLTQFRERTFNDQEIESAEISRVLDRLHKTQEREVNLLNNQFDRNHVKSVAGFGSFIDRNTIKVDNIDGSSRKYKADKIIISVGTKCFRPSNLDFDGKYVCDSDQILEVEDIPDKVLVVGAGVIGVEYASILNVLGKKVILIDPRSQYLEFIDREIIDEFTKILTERGVDFKLGRKLDQVLSKDSNEVNVQLDNGDTLTVGMVLFAAGRLGSTDGLNLGSCNIDVDKRGRISVDPETFQTSADNIYAVGDVIGFPALASTSMAQGRIAACHAFGREIFSLPKVLPYGIYAVPEISTAGMSEHELNDEGIDYVKGIGLFRETARGEIMGVESGFMKLLFSREDERLLGVHIIGEGASELIHIGQAVMQLNGCMNYFVENVFNFPTLAEAYKIAALNAWNKIN